MKRLFQIAGLGIFYLVFISLVPVMQATAMLNCYRLLEQLLLETRTTADVQRDLSTHRETMLTASLDDVTAQITTNGLSISCLRSAICH